ncbi:hypothetical protein HK101_002395 [Irineochytrium annulatum]|nr:hypothetical protein HK101_002395 [Irineochytrium annulatum]
MSAAEPAAQASEEGVRVFAGNLAFAVTDEDLKTEFGKAGTVLSATIIFRNGRSKGYGFVTFATEEEATRAVELLDKVELSGRPLNVEVAKPKAEGEAAPRPPRVRNRKKGKADAAAGDAPAADGGEVAAEGRPRRARGGRQEARIDQDEAPEAGVDGDAPKPRRKPRNKKKKPAAAATEEGGAAAEAPAAADGGAAAGEGKRARRPRVKREKPAAGDAPDGPPSDTLLFVANLPFKVDDEALKVIFSGYKVTSAQVVCVRSGRSKGYGFVEVADKAEQTRVLSELQNVQVDGRDLIIRAGRQSSHKADAEAQE